jgi:hypothetical protein
MLTPAQQTLLDEYAAFLAAFTKESSVWIQQHTVYDQKMFAARIPHEAIIKVVQESNRGVQEGKPCQTFF